MGQIDILTQNLVETIVKGHSYYEMITGMGDSPIRLSNCHCQYRWWM